MEYNSTNFNFYMDCITSLSSESTTGTGWFSKMSASSFSVQKGMKGGGDTGRTGASVGCTGIHSSCTGGDSSCTGADIC